MIPVKFQPKIIRINISTNKKRNTAFIYSTVYIYLFTYTLKFLRSPSSTAYPLLGHGGTRCIRETQTSLSTETPLPFYSVLSSSWLTKSLSSLWKVMPQSINASPPPFYRQSWTRRSPPPPPLGLLEQRVKAKNGKRGLISNLRACNDLYYPLLLGISWTGWASKQHYVSQCSFLKFIWFSQTIKHHSFNADLTSSSPQLNAVCVGTGQPLELLSWTEPLR